MPYKENSSYNNITASKHANKNRTLSLVEVYICERCAVTFAIAYSLQPPINQADYLIV